MSRHVSSQPALVTSSRLLAGALFGGQAIWLTTTVPTYRRLPPADYLRVHTLLTWYGDALMPATGIAATLTAYARYRRSGQLRALVAAAALTGAGVAAIPNLRINARARTALEAGELTPPAADQVGRDRDRWARNHALRTAGGLVAYLALLGDDGDRVAKIGRPGAKRRLGWLDGAAAMVAVFGGREVVQHLALMAGDARRGGPRRAPAGQ